MSTIWTMLPLLVTVLGLMARPTYACNCVCMCSKDGNKVYMPQISGQSRSLVPLWYVHVRMLALCACTDAKSLKPHVRFLLSNSTFTRTRLRVTKACMPICDISRVDLQFYSVLVSVLLKPVLNARTVMLL